MSDPVFDLPTRQRRILGIDIENAPLWYGGGDFVYDYVTCVSFKWASTESPEVYDDGADLLLTETIMLDWRLSDRTLLRLLQPLWAAMDEADAYLGHNFRHDWKGVQALFRELEQPPLLKKPIIDTMRCIPAGIPRGLEALVAKFGLGEKPHVPNHVWIAGIHRRDPQALKVIEYRNAIDVVLTERLFWKEKELGWL